MPGRGWVVVGILSLSSGAALADGGKVSFPACTTVPTEADRKAAQGAFAAGQGSFNEADYATAIMYWRDAYRRDCTAHLLLTNLARAYELKGDRAEAVVALETYLQRRPDAPDTEQIKRRIENLKAQIAAEKPAPAPPPSTPPPPVAAAPTTPVSPAQDSAASHGRSAMPLLALGAPGVVAAVVGTVFWLGGASKISDAEPHCDSSRHCDQQQYITEGNDGRSQEAMGGVFLGVGVAAIAGGVIWYFAQPSASTAGAARSTTATHLVPAVGRGFTGLSLAGHF